MNIVTVFVLFIGTVLLLPFKSKNARLTLDEGSAPVFNDGS